MIFVHSERLASFKLEEFGRKLALPMFLSQRLAKVDSLHTSFKLLWVRKCHLHF